VNFITAVRAEKQVKPKTVQFYTYSLDSLLRYEPLAEARLTWIDERIVQRLRLPGAAIVERITLQRGRADDEHPVDRSTSSVCR